MVGSRRRGEMRAQVLHVFSGPQGFRYEEVPALPLSSATDVRVRIEACGVCHRDITYSHGKFGGGRLPTIMGHEGAGVVVEVGNEVDDLASGDRVVHLQFPFCGVCERCAAGQPQLCPAVRGAIGEVRPGAYATEIVLPRHLLVRVPEGVGLEPAAVVACTLGTAYHALTLYGFQPAGKTVAINGAGGGVGIHAIQVAKAMGSRVIAVTSSPDKEQAIAEAGADEVVVARDGRYRVAMLRLTERQGVDLFLEVVGAPTMQESLLSVGPAGRIVITGNPEGGTCVFNPALLILRGELRMYGTLAVTAGELEQVLALVAQGTLRPIIDVVAPLQELVTHMLRMERRETVGRVVVRP
jgi:acryloyl-coenzyme A reductase